MIELPEYATAFADDQPAPDAPRREQISRELGARLGVEWLAGGRVAIKASSWVGTIDLTSDLSVRVGAGNARWRTMPIGVQSSRTASTSLAV